MHKPHRSCLFKPFFSVIGSRIACETTRRDQCKEDHDLLCAHQKQRLAELGSYACAHYPRRQWCNLRLWSVMRSPLCYRTPVLQDIVHSHTSRRKYDDGQVSYFSAQAKNSCRHTLVTDLNASMSLWLFRIYEGPAGWCTDSIRFWRGH